MGWSRGVFSFLSLALPVLASLSALAVGASRLNLPSQAFWQGKASLVLAALVVTSLPSAVQAFLLERGERRRRRELEQEEKLRVILMTALVDLVKNCELHWETTGVRAFVTKKKWRLMKKWWFLGEVHQHDRVGLVKLNSGPASGITWVDGKGIVGRCWATKGERQFENFGKFTEYTNGTWMALSPEDRYSLTFEELKLMRERYGLTAAVPMLNGTEYIGCITMDTEPDPRSTPDRVQVWRSLGFTAALVKNVLVQ